MSRKRCVRRKWSEVDPIQHAMARAAKLPDDELDDQIKPVGAACARMIAGTWDMEDWLNVREAASRIYALMDLHNVSKGTFLEEVGLTLSACGDRFASKGTKALRAEEIKVMRWVLESYSDVLQQTTRGKFQDACKKVSEAMSKARAERRNKSRTIDVNELMKEKA